MPRRKASYNELPQPVQSRGPGRPPKQEPLSESQEEPLSGLYIFGQVIDRTRRTIKTRNDGQAEIVTYTVQDVNGRRYFVDEYTPEQYCEIGEAVELPVYVKTFKKNSGDIGYSFCVQQQFGPARGEHF